MLSSLLEWIQKHFPEALAILAGVVILVLTLINPQWWGDRSYGVLVGFAATILIIVVLVFAVRNVRGEIGWLIAWALVLVPTGIALFLRRPAAGATFRLTLPQLNIPATPSPQSLSLIMIGVLLLILLLVFIRSVRRGETVSIESHWGGLGGGIVGWQLSGPFVYLLGIIFLVVIASAVAWRAFPSQQSQPAPQSAEKSAVPAASGPPSESATPVASPSRSASP